MAASLTPPAGSHPPTPATTPSGEWLFEAWRLLWMAGFAAMFFVNVYTAPLAEWTDRDKAVAAVRLGLKIPAYPSPSPAGEVVFAFGAAGKTLGLRGGEYLIAVDGRPMPADGAGRARTMAGPDDQSVALTFRRQDGSTHTERIVRSPGYERHEMAGAGIDVATRRFATFLIDLFSRQVGLVAALILFVRRPLIVASASYSR